MKAVVFESPSPTAALTFVRDAEPPRPEPGQVLIGVEYAGINYIDVMARRGDAGYASGWPYTPGLEVSGSVVAVGSPADSPFAIGDRVAAFTAGGGLAEQVVADESLVAPIPSTVESSFAAAAPLMLSTAILLVKGAARFQAGDAVLMHAAGGGVGSAIAQLVLALGGGQLVGTVTHQDKAAPALAAGWQHVLVRDDAFERSFAELVPGGADVILDPLGTEMLDLDTRLAAPGGRIVVFGNPGGSGLADLPRVGALIGGNLSIGGFSISRLSRRAPDRVASALTEGLALLDEGRIDLPLIVHQGLDTVAETHELLAARRSAGKYVIKVG